MTLTRLLALTANLMLQRLATGHFLVEKTGQFLAENNNAVALAGSSAALVVAKSPIESHSVGMASVHPFTFKVDADPLSDRRFRWSICEGDQIHMRSPHSYATRREAEMEAGKALLKRASLWSDKR